MATTLEVRRIATTFCNLALAGDPKDLGYTPPFNGKKRQITAGKTVVGAMPER